MKLTEFRISMYKGIIDTGWVDVNRLTVLVGKNESGKTSLLEALHKLHPVSEERYEIKKEWPRSRLPERKPDHVVCRARFKLTGEEKSDIFQIINVIEEIPDTVEVSRSYAGDLKINFEEDFPLDDTPSVQFDSNSLQETLDTLPEVKENFSIGFRNAAVQCHSDLIDWIDNKHSTKFSQLSQKHKSFLQEARSLSNSSSFSAEGQFINTYQEILDQLADLFEELPSTQSRVNEYLADHLPKFIYMDDYTIFTGRADLNEIKDRKDSGKLTGADNTFITILELSGLDINELVPVDPKDMEAIEERQNALVGGSESLTKIIRPRLSQRKYAIEFGVDGQYFFTKIKDNHDPTPIQLEERSRGFQWFFSFDLMLTHATPGDFKGCVILFDEPGLHLHPEAQKNLLERLKKYATENTLIYTTHLPFMIDMNYPDRIRILKEKDNKIVVETNLTGSDDDSRFVLQSALGMNASQNFLIAKRNLVVEGVDDFWILTELSNLLKRDGKSALPEDVLITPSNGASKAVPIVNFMIGQQLNVVALFDSDNEGRIARDKLEEAWLTQANKEIFSEVIMLGNAVDVEGDFELEDLFPEDFYLESVKKTYPNQLKGQSINDINLPGEGMLWKKVVGFLKKNGIGEPNKRSVAQHLRKKLIQMKDASELPQETQKKARKLFKAIRKELGEEETNSSDFISAAPSSGEIPANGTITVTFDNTPTDLSVSPGIVRVAGKTATIKGPFTPGPLALTIIWADGSKVLNYTVTASDNDPPTVTGGTVKDGETDVNPEDINTDGKIEILFNEDVSGNISMQTKSGDDVGWQGKVEGNKATLEVVKGKEINNETIYVIKGKVSDAAGNSTDVNVTFVTISRDTRSRTDQERSESDQRHIEYWTGLREYMRKKGSSIISPSPRPSSSLRLGIGRTNFQIMMSLTRNQISICLTISGNNAEAHFHLLRQQQEEIHTEFRETLEWHELPGFQRSRICLNESRFDLLDITNWERQYEWFATNLELFNEVFRPRIKTLNAADWNRKNVQGTTIPPVTSDTG